MDMVYDFPWWLRVEHFVNIIFITFFIRSGIEILGTFPRLHRSVHMPAGKQWAEFTIKSKPKHKYYSVGSEYEDYSPIVSLPGKGLLGIGRYWHFMAVIGFTVCFIIYYALLIFTGQGMRYIPQSWDVFPQAVNDMITYLAFQTPEALPGMPFNAVQQLSYGFIILIMPAFMIFTGFFQAPAVNQHWPKITRALGGRQVIRSLHFFGLVIYMVFIVIHVAMVIAHGYGHEVSKMVFGHTESPIAGGIIFTIGLAFVVWLHVIATRTSLEKPRLIEKLHNVVVRPLTRQLIKLPSRANSAWSKDRGKETEHFRASGHSPETDEYAAMVSHNYDDVYYLEIGGFVEKPMRFSLPELREIAKGYEQTTMHNCVQGFSSIGTWGGVPLHVLLDMVKPLPGSSDVVFKSFQMMGRDDPLYPEGWYYESAPMSEATQPETLVAISLNGEDVPVKNGAPLRMRLETSTGFRSIKWVERIEVVNRYDIIGKGRGGWFEDFDNYDRLQMI
ncbi:molybdopterin-dependent oxidoreductase [Corynebacterium renale]|uniref:Cytochrome b561-like protein n=2 Tax=Corynebacterium renale TaxID=1724 RepID=A0A2A9DQ87_9CORY|nr:molybdopterin-dependent oxidoreductase [Corynebacterium renale]PFG28927.1 cytochrome b561-like protein [Corynebacterium renale]SQI25554.1 oxidoreductase molybdopterin binding protein [Corynebacterium renale]